MKRLFAMAMIVSLGSLAFAGDFERPHDPFASEAQSILAEYRDRAPAELTFGEIDGLAAALSVPAQKSAYVRSSAMASLMMPGLGQFRNGDALSGTLFLLGDIAVVAGTAIGLYYLLPPELQFDQLDYFNTPVADIHAAWEAAGESATFREMLPFMGVATGGMILQHIVAGFSAHHAARLATRNIEDGTVTFTPRAGFMMGPHGHMSLGFGMKY